MFDYSKYILEEGVLIERVTLLYFLRSNTLLHRAVCLVPRMCYGGSSDQSFLFAHYALQPHTLFRLWRDISDFSTLCMEYNMINITAEGVLTPFFLITEIFVFTQSYLICIVQLLGDDELKLANDSPTNITVFTNICC